MFGLFKKKPLPPEPPTQFPPTPDWQPQISQPLDRIAERIRCYTNGTRDFAVFTHGTVAILPHGLNDINAKEHATQALHQVLHSHPDMNPLSMKDGNILIQYKHDIASLVLSDIADQNWAEIDKQYLRALATSEVLITPLGHNTFDDFGKKALFGRCFMFMDAQAPKIVHIERHDG
ncbi:hypothetical protein [Undibacterium crateris]|uniref:hypothetical protein n=1 Tax=Undibacterium crateris TaxID=2528175 RepID=UPI00138A2196|nr:hypothetical protein [Undibacterium crateris]NDI84384.1 hypothetical protein [Undibacterium crateris]